MVKVILSALRYIRTLGPYDRYILITEDTIPLQRPQDLYAHLQMDVEFIHSYPVPVDSEDSVRRRYENFYYFDSKATNPRYIGDPVNRTITEDDQLAIERLKNVRERGKVSLPTLRHGSTYWALTDDAVARILFVDENDQELRESFEFSAIPEEQYFHTILELSNWRRPNHMFIHFDFSRTPAPYVYRSRAEIQALQGQAVCMVRKVDIGAEEVKRFMLELIA